MDGHDSATVGARLAALFDPREVKFKPQSVKGNRALAMAYIDARLVMDRLDDVMGWDGWKDEYMVLNDGSAVCHLSLRIGSEWVTKSDVGSPSEQPDAGDRMKAAFSDALKRVAVKFGIGRYLYRLPSVWTDYDPQKKCFAQTPQLPAWAVPKPADTKPGPPKTGQELYDRLVAFEAVLVRERLCEAGELLLDVADKGQQAGYPAMIKIWTAGPQMEFGQAAAKNFEAARRQAKKAGR